MTQTHDKDSAVIVPDICFSNLVSPLPGSSRRGQKNSQGQGEDLFSKRLQISLFWWPG